MKFPKGNDAFRRGDYASAFQRYTEVLECDPYATVYNAIIHCNRAAASMSMGEFEKAVADCTEAIKLDGKFIYMNATLICNRFLNLSNFFSRLFLNGI